MQTKYIWQFKYKTQDPRSHSSYSITIAYLQKAKPSSEVPKTRPRVQHDPKKISATEFPIPTSRKIGSADTFFPIPISRHRKITTVLYSVWQLFHLFRQINAATTSLLLNISEVLRSRSRSRSRFRRQFRNLLLSDKTFFTREEKIRFGGMKKNVWLCCFGNSASAEILWLNLMIPRTKVCMRRLGTLASCCRNRVATRGVPSVIAMTRADKLRVGMSSYHLPPDEPENCLQVSLAYFCLRAQPCLA